MVFNNRKPGKVKKLSQKELDKLLENMGGIEKVLEDFARHERDVEFFEYHHKELLEKYPDKWVAVYDVEVIDTDKDFFALLDHLKEKGIPTNKTVIHFMDTDPKPLILVQQGAVFSTSPFSFDKTSLKWEN